MIGPVNWSSPINWNNSVNRGLVSWWLNVPYWQGGTTWRDLAGRNDGTLTSMVPIDDWRNISHPGGFGSLDFDGSNDFVDMGLPGSLRLTSSMTISAWIKASVVDSNHYDIVSRQEPADLGYDLRILDNNKWRILIPISASVISQRRSSADATTNWTYISGVYNALQQELHFYVDGELNDGTLIGDVPSSMYDGTANVNIGRRPFTGAFNYFNGLLDDVRIYNRSLSAVEIRQVYQDSLAGYPRTLRRLKRRGVAVPVAPPDAGRAKFLPLLGVA